jgi:hypothetical protein
VETGEQTWIARVTPTPGTSVEDLLGLPLGLDVWERYTDSLVVAASDDRLDELERRRMAEVTRLTTTAQYTAQRPGDPPATPEG